MTFSVPTAHLSPLFHDLKLLNFDDLHELFIAVFVYECHNNFAPSHFAIILPRPHTYTRKTPEVLQEVTFSWARSKTRKPRKVIFRCFLSEFSSEA